MKIINKCSFAVFGAVLCSAFAVYADDREVEKSNGYSSYTEEDPKIDVGSKILLIGDSHVGGMSHRFKLIAKQMGYVPIVSSINGSKTNDSFKRLKEIVETQSPKLVIIESGTNDMFCDENWVENHEHLYENIVSFVKEHGAEVVWLSPPATSAQMKHQERIKKLILEAVSEESYFDLTDFALTVSKDKVHLTREGYEELSELLWNWLASKNLVGIGC
jgi:GDSL-like Lipase/Acylhydrolase family